MPRQFTISAAILCWLLIAAGGVFAFWKYELTAGVGNEICHQWPRDSSLSPPDKFAVLLMFVHPQCGCTTAGLRELKSLMDRTDVRQLPSIIFVLLQPEDAARNWIGTKNEVLCRQFPDSRIVYDIGGIEASRFGIDTSGMCLLYSRNGDLVFSGGVTASRGHLGPNRGQEFLAQAISSNDAVFRSFPAFGCSLTLSPSQVVHGSRTR